MSFSLFAQEYNVEILGKSIIEPGDEVEARIARIDGALREEFFEGQIISSVLFVLIDNNEKTRFLVKQAPPKEKQIVDKKFVIKGAQFKDTKTQTNYTLFENDYVYKNKRSTRNIYFFCILLILILFFLIQYLKKRKRKLKLKTNRLVLMKKIETASARKDFEEIYEMRSLIEKSIKYNKNDFMKLLQTINSIQYKKTWTDEQLHEVKKQHKKAISKMEILDGL